MMQAAETLLYNITKLKWILILRIRFRFLVRVIFLLSSFILTYIILFGITQMTCTQRHMYNKMTAVIMLSVITLKCKWFQTHINKHLFEKAILIGYILFENLRRGKSITRTYIYVPVPINFLIDCQNMVLNHFLTFPNCSIFTN